MPEGPEIKTIARSLSHALIGQRLGAFWHSDYCLRGKAVNYGALNELRGKPIASISTYGKILFVEANTTKVLMIQLGMTGRLFVASKDSKSSPHTHLKWQLLNSKKELRYEDPRRFGLISSCDQKTKKAILSRLGPDPFVMTTADFAEIIAKFRRSKRAIKDIIMDQSIIVGVGNIYASEALFLAKINPKKPAGELTTKEYEVLLKAIVTTLTLADRNSGTTFSSFVDGLKNKGNHSEFLHVFQKTGQPCSQCRQPILRIKQAGRSTFYCSACQE